MNDPIDRQAAIDAICKEGTRLERNGTVAMCEIKQWCVDLLEQLPSAQPNLPEWARKVEEYRKSVPDTIYNPLAWALYQVWKEYDR